MTHPEVLLFRASLYISALHNQIIFAPRVTKSPPLYPSLDESSYANDEPVTVLPLDSSPMLLGNRLKATLLASRPKALDEHERLRPSFVGVPDKQTLIQEAAKVPRKAPVYLDMFGKRPGKRLVKDPVLLASSSDDYASFESQYRYWFVEATETEIAFLGVPPKPSGERQLTRKSLRLECSDSELGEFILKLWVSE